MFSYKVCQENSRWMTCQTTCQYVIHNQKSIIYNFTPLSFIACIKIALCHKSYYCKEETACWIFQFVRKTYWLNNCWCGCSSGCIWVLSSLGGLGLYWGHLARPIRNYALVRAIGLGGKWNHVLLLERFVRRPFDHSGTWVKSVDSLYEGA